MMSRSSCLNYFFATFTGKFISFSWWLSDTKRKLLTLLYFCRSSFILFFVVVIFLFFKGKKNFCSCFVFVWNNGKCMMCLVAVKLIIAIFILFSSSRSKFNISFKIYDYNKFQSQVSFPDNYISHHMQILKHEWIVYCLYNYRWGSSAKV